MKPKRTMDLTQGPVLKQLFLYVVPIFFTTLLQTLYNAADRMVVGRFAGPNALAAVGCTGYASAMFTTLVIGISTGANVIIANFRGARKKDDMRKAMHVSVLISAYCGIALMAIGLLIARPMMQLLDTPEAVIDGSVLYMRIIFCGMPFSMIYNFGAASLRASGDTRRPMTILSISGIVNVVLNLIFVICFHMTVDGVALATIISQAVSAVWILWILFNPKDEYGLNRKELRFYKGITGLIIRTGIPLGINTALQNFAGLFLQDATNAFGPAVMAGSSASDSITGIIATLPSTMFTGCVSFAGQCYGARKYKRLDKLMVCSMLLGGGITALLALFCTFFPELPLSLFTSDPASIEAGVSKLIIVAWGYMILCVGNSTLGVLRGMGKSIGPTVVSVCCFTVVRLLWIWFIFPLHKTPAMLFMCIIISFACNTVGQLCYYVSGRKALNKKEAASAAK